MRLENKEVDLRCSETEALIQAKAPKGFQLFNALQYPAVLIALDVWFQLRSSALDQNRKQPFGKVTASVWSHDLL